MAIIAKILWQLEQRLQTICKVCDKGVFQRLHQHFVNDPDMEWLIIDTTIVRAHPCAAGALKTSGGQDSQALGRSRGGFSTKIHVAVDGLGNPLRFQLSAGQQHDITCAEALIDGYSSEYVIATHRMMRRGVLSR